MTDADVARFAALGAKRAAAVLDCDLDYEGPAAAWLGATLGALATLVTAGLLAIWVAHYLKTPPATATTP